jgi:hypothetical protein
MIFFIFHLRDGCGLLAPFSDFPPVPNNVRLAQGEAAAAPSRGYDLEVEDD